MFFIDVEGTTCIQRGLLDIVEEALVFFVRLVDVVASTLAKFLAIRIDLVNTRAFQNGFRARLIHIVAVINTNSQPLLAIESELIRCADVAHQVVQVLLAQLR